MYSRLNNNKNSKVHTYSKRSTPKPSTLRPPPIHTLSYLGKYHRIGPLSRSPCRLTLLLPYVWSFSRTLPRHFLTGINNGPDSTMADGSPPRPQSLRIGLRNFLPLSEDAVSTRGQRLPSIIRERSTASIKDLRAQFAQRHQSTYINDRDNDQDVEREGDSQGRDKWGDGPREMQRRMSNGSQALMTPQMRSMRLIGRNNPRYEW